MEGRRLKWHKRTAQLFYPFNYVAFFTLSKGTFLFLDFTSIKVDAFVSFENFFFEDYS
jgi:hypothetical protein